MSASYTPTWDGDINNPPKLYWPFVFRGKEYSAVKNGSEFLVIDTANQSFSLPMTIRLSPGTTGHLVADVLLKSGLYTAEEVATALENEDDEKIASMVYGLVAASKEKGQTWLKSKGISSEDLTTFLLESKTKILMRIFSF